FDVHDKLNHNIQNGTIDVDVVRHNSPIFRVKNYTFTMTPNTSQIGTILAYPYDQNSRLVYELLNENDNNFSIDFDNGTIFAVKRPTNKDTVLNVIARDLIYGQNSTIKVLVKSNNNNDDDIKFQSNIYYTEMPEVMPPGSTILKITTVSQRDDIRYQLLEHNENLFHIDAITGIITLTNWLHYELQSFYSFYVHIINNSSFSQAIIEIDVKDYNNHAPIFINLNSHIELSKIYIESQQSEENKKIFVTKLTAYDLDQNQLMYHLMENSDENLFEINSQTGIIMLITHQQQFLSSRYELKVGVTDGLYVTVALLSISISDYSLNRPTFDQTMYTFKYRVESVNENDIIYKQLGQIRAIDKDNGDDLKYELIEERL
ncbi:unnamed protein product, partial [Didymodactylos carnosus]